LILKKTQVVALFVSVKLKTKGLKLKIDKLEPLPQLIVQKRD